jgi:hypothetical protein
LTIDNAEFLAIYLEYVPDNIFRAILDRWHPLELIEPFGTWNVRAARRFIEMNRRLGTKTGYIVGARAMKLSVTFTNIHAGSIKSMLVALSEFNGDYVEFDTVSGLPRYQDVHQLLRYFAPFTILSKAEEPTPGQMSTEEEGVLNWDQSWFFDLASLLASDSATSMDIVCKLVPYCDRETVLRAAVCYRRFTDRWQKALKEREHGLSDEFTEKYEIPLPAIQGTDAKQAAEHYTLNTFGGLAFYGLLECVRDDT